MKWSSSQPTMMPLPLKKELFGPCPDEGYFFKLL